MKVTALTPAIISLLLIAGPALAHGGGGGHGGGGISFGGGHSMGGMSFAAGHVASSGGSGVHGGFSRGYGYRYGRYGGRRGIGAWGGYNNYNHGTNQHYYVPPGPNAHDVDPSLPRSAFVQTYSWSSTPSYSRSNGYTSSVPQSNLGYSTALAGQSHMR